MKIEVKLEEDKIECECNAGIFSFSENIIELNNPNIVKLTCLSCGNEKYINRDDIK